MTIKTIPGIPLYGNQKYRDKDCPREYIEQITFVTRVRTKYPDNFGLTLIHPENEGQLISGQFSKISKSKAMGMSQGASDIIIPGNPAFVMEIKRRDRTKSSISDEQITYLLAAKECGAFVCIALGADAATEAFDDWLKINKPPVHNF